MPIQRREHIWIRCWKEVAPNQGPLAALGPPMMLDNVLLFIRTFQVASQEIASNWLVQEESSFTHKAVEHT